MHILKTTFAIGLLCAAATMPTLAQEAAAPAAEAEAGAAATDRKSTRLNSSHS